MAPRSLPLVLLGLSLGGCRQVDPAPTALEDLMHFFFLDFDSEETERLQEGVDNLLAWQAREGSSEGSTGSLGVLSAEAKEAVGLDGDLSDEWLKGVFELVPRAGCTAREHGDIYAFDDQPALFPGQYDGYDRTYHTDVDCYRGQECAEAEWSAHIEGNVGLAKGTYDYIVQMRDLESSAGETVTMTRAWLPEPAVVGQDEGQEAEGDPEQEGTFFDQSYSIEVFAPLAGAGDGGESLHLYALWNSAGHPLFSPDSEFWERQYLKGVEDWNDRLDELCDEDRALWQ